MESLNSASKRFGVRHWLFQIAPPTLILLTLFSTRNGAALVFLAGFFVIPVLVSLISIVLKLFAFRTRRYFLPRPALTVVFFTAVLAIAHWSYAAALGQATNAAERLHSQCQSDLACPAEPKGWEVDGRRISRRDLGTLYKYSASYHYNPDSFDIRLYQGPDLGHVLTGGVDVPFRVATYVED